MKRSLLYFMLISCQFPVYSEEITQYHGEFNTRASDFAKEFFGNAREYQQQQSLNMGNVGFNVSSRLNCGNLDVNANIQGEFNEILEQIKKIIPTDISSALPQMAMVSTCYAYPTICAELRHDFLSLKANLNLRSQACQAIDKFIDNQADKGAMQLVAEAKAECIRQQTDSGMDTASAIKECERDAKDANGNLVRKPLALRDFQAGLEKRFTTRKQKVLESVVKFAQAESGPMYAFLAPLLGEIEVQSDGYWQPLFAQGMLRPNDMAQSFLAQGKNQICHNLSEIISKRIPPQESVFDRAIVTIAQSRLSQDDLMNIEDLGDEDKTLACSALGRSVAQMAAQKATAEGQAVIASGLLNTAIPNALREEFRNRSDTTFLALKKTIETEQIPPIDEVRTAIANLATVTREKNRLIANQISGAKLQNSRQESIIKNDCTDTLSCGGQ